MLDIRNLYKKKKSSIINDISLKVEKSELVSIEVDSELSDELIKLILHKDISEKGEIYIDGIKNSEYINQNMKSIGVIFREEGFYERLTVEEYLRHYAEIIGSEVNYKEVIEKLSLIDLAHQKIKRLNYSKRKVVSLAREILKEPKILIFQDPIFNIDKDSARIILENIEELCSKGTAILCMSVSFKDVMLIGGKTYIIDENGLKENENKKDEDNSESINKGETVFLNKIQKIPAKIEERILLFDPAEIDYIESESGMSSLNVRGEKFPCMMSLAELEERLKCFGFFRCHRSYIVNMQKIREVITWTRNSYNLTIDNKIKSTIPLSKGKLVELKNILKI